MTDLHDELIDLIGATGVDFVLTMFVDLDGKPCAKLVPATATDVVASGASFAGFAAGPLFQNPADPDLVAVPDSSSFTVLPWEPTVAAVMCDLHSEGDPWPYAPRVLLRSALERLRERGYVMKTGVEAEYSLVRRIEGGSLVVADDRDTAANPCYDVHGLMRMLPHLGEVSGHLDALGFGNYANDHEDANGQFEQNFGFADAVTTADRLILFRFLVRSVAERRGMTATFMPKPFTAGTGNGLHVHTSLWDLEDRPAFATDAAEDHLGLGLTKLGYSFVGGILDHAPALSAFASPTVNSYKRLGANAPRSGATWAPSLVAYGGNNRTHMVRVPEPARFEYRAVDGSANPYLVFTALLAAGLDGVDSGLDPGSPNEDNLFELGPEEREARGLRSLPPTLLHAADLLVGDDVLRAAFGSGPRGDFVDLYAELKRREFLEWHAHVTDWEIDRYLEAV